MTTINEGGYFGELALVTHKVRAATVTANVEDVRVACEYLHMAVPFLSLELPLNLHINSREV